MFVSKNAIQYGIIFIVLCVTYNKYETLKDTLLEPLLETNILIKLSLDLGSLQQTSCVVSSFSLCQMLLSKNNLNFMDKKNTTKESINELINLVIYLSIYLSVYLCHITWISWNLSFRYIYCTGQFTPKMKANAEPPLISSLVWIDCGIEMSQHRLESFFIK